MDEFNMYQGFIDDNTFATLPFFEIAESDTDVYVQWTIGSKLDKIAYDYYNNAALWKFILLANPKYFTEGDIEIDDIVRIPFPKENIFASIRDGVAKYSLF
jgi:hypothetical protein